MVLQVCMCYKIISWDTMIRARSGRPPKIDRKILNKARHWCEGRAFTPVELHGKLEEMSGKSLAISQVRRYAREWGYSRKKTHATNLERQYIKRTIKDIPEKYKKRWRIENNFKSVEQIRARTCSRNHAIRVFMFFLSMTVCNLWYTAVRNMNDMMETGRRRHVKINITADVFLALLIVLVKKIITSVNKELNYYLQCVR